MKVSHLKVSPKVAMIFIFLVALSLRFWKLGQIPDGVSLAEAQLAINMSHYVGNWIFDPFFIRLPFTLLGIISLALFFSLMQKIIKQFWFSYVCTFFLALSPWHVAFSRIYSPGMVVFVGVLIILIATFTYFDKHLQKISNVLLGIAACIFVVSLFLIPPELKEKVNVDRTIARNMGVGKIAPVFSNKFIESARLRTSIAFENLDFGNYFFKGHPRQRWGTEEMQKLSFVLLPFLLLGFFALKKREAMFFLCFSTLIIALLTAFNQKTPEFTLPLIIPQLFIITSGIFLVKQKRRILFIVTVIFIIESIMFYGSYYKNREEGAFSPRRPIFEKLVRDVNALKANESGVLVSSRIGNPEPFFKFYLKEPNLQNYTFTDFDIRKEKQRNYLYVDVLPDDPSPNEPLYKKDNVWANYLEVIKEIYDDRMRQTIVIYRLK